jgi:phospholipid/cholesterol/gamma-HCH transport system substrate-binding protein
MTPERWRRALGLFLFVCFGLGVAVYLLGRVGTTILPSGPTYNFEADVHDSYALASNADVREAGVRIGQVTGIKQAGTLTALELSIDKQYGPVYNNATVLIRTKSIAGENYVQLDPGTPSSGQVPSGGVLPVNQELQAVQDDDVFSIFSAPQRQGLQRALKGLGSGLSGQGGNNLNSTLASMTALVDDGQGFAQVLDQERGATAQLLGSFDGVATALGERAQDIQTLTRDALTTAAAVSQRNAALRSTLAQLPSFVSQTRTTADRLGAFSLNATPVMTDLRIAFTKLIPAMDDLRPAALEANTALARLEQFATVALPTFLKLTPFTRTTAALISPYATLLRSLSSFSRYISPYRNEVGSWFANTAAAVEATDPIGHLARVTLPISRSNFPTIFQGQAEQILAKLSGGLDTRGTDAYPLAGNADTPEPQSAYIPPVSATPPFDAKPPRPLRPS